MRLFGGAVTDERRNAYRSLLSRLGATDLSDQTVEKYIRYQRIRMAVYLPICIGLIAWVIYIWVR